MKAERWVISVGVVVSLLLHAVAAVWWLRQPVMVPVEAGSPAVTVDLIMPTQAPVAAAPVAQPPPPSVVQPEPDMLKDNEMAVQRKVVKKKPKPQVMQPSVPSEQPAKPTAAVAAAPAPAAATQQTAASAVTAASFDANYLSAPAAYPPLSRRLGEEGRVVLRVKVSADGRPIDIALKTSSGFSRLDQEAIKTVARWQFKPAQQNGRAMASMVDVPILFKLQKAR